MLKVLTKLCLLIRTKIYMCVTLFWPSLLFVVSLFLCLPVCHSIKACVSFFLALSLSDCLLIKMFDCLSISNFYWFLSVCMHVCLSVCLYFAKVSVALQSLIIFDSLFSLPTFFVQSFLIFLSFCLWFVKVSVNISQLSFTCKIYDMIFNKLGLA